MKWVKRLVGLIVVLIVALVAIAYLLPREVSVARSIEIAAAPDAIFPYLNNHKASNEWSPWAEKDPNTKWTFTGPESGVGAKMKWESESDQVGTGTSEIIKSEDGKHVVINLDFGDMGTAEAGFVLEPSGAGTKVTWGFKTDLGMNPMGRYFGLMFDEWIGADYEKGLSNLKKLVESKPSG